MEIKHNKVSSEADSGDSTKIQPSNWNEAHVIDGLSFITEDTTFTIKADGTGSYPTLRDCIADLNSTVIHPLKSITINLDAGVHVQSAIIADLNPCNRYFIIGATPASVSITAAAAATGSADNFSVVYTLSTTVPADIVVGMFLSIHNNGADWVAGYLHFGCHEITAVGSNTLTCKVKNHNTPQTVSSVSIPANIIKTVVKAGFTATSALWSVGTAQGKGYFGSPYMKNMVLNGDNRVSYAFTIYHHSFVMCYPGTTKTYNLGFVNATTANIYLTEQSVFIAYDGTIVVSSSENGGLVLFGISRADLGSWNIFSGNRGSGGLLRAIHLDTSDGISFSTLLIDNRYSAITMYGGIMRVTAIRESNWGSSGITSSNSGINVGA